MRLTTPDRVLWPATGTTKRQMLEYYLAVSDALMPHLRDRPVALHRFPEGVTRTHFYEIRSPPRPEWVRAVTQRPESGKVFDMVVIDSRAALAWTSNLSAIELHPYLHLASSPARPHAMVFDLDPRPPASIVDVCRVARWIHDVLAAHSLRSHVKTSGGRGVHVYVPLGGTHPYAETKEFARAVATVLADADPELVTAQAHRPGEGKVRIDWAQNDQWKSMVAPYSLRGARVPSVSLPVLWSEVEQVVADGHPRCLPFTPDDALTRLAAHGDLFAPVVTDSQTIATISG